MRLIELADIKRVLPGIDLISATEEAFVAYSQGRSVVPPVGELLFEDPPGEVHIKYGYLIGDASYVIKIASGFPDNPKRNLPSGNGLMLLFDQKTGELQSVLLDRGYLTDARTAVAGAVVAKHLAPRAVDAIGIVGTGLQARMQLQYLCGVIPCRRAIVWGRSAEKLERYRADMEAEGFSIKTTQDMDDLTAGCNLIVTTTASSSPLISGDQIRPGTHITAMGSDTERKQELDVSVLERADLVVADSLPQCRVRGEIAHALKAGAIEESKLVELGNVISGKVPPRISENQITVADLTGVAVQDIQIAKAVYMALQGH